MEFLDLEEPVSPEPESESESETWEALDPFRVYLREIAKYPLMTREEEKETALRTRLGTDKEAFEKLVHANLMLVVKMALEYRSHPNLLDLVQEGNMGLLRAVAKYDPERGMRFSTYASFWIRAYMLKYLMNTWSMVKIGTVDSQRRLFYRLRRERDRLEKSGITPSSGLLADNLEASTAEIEEMEHRLYRRDASLEAPQHGDGDPLMDMLGSGEDIEETLIEKNHTEILQGRLADFKKLLSDKERFILEYRIMAEEPLTLREIGQRFNASRESVRQMQVKISKRLEKNLRRVRFDHIYGEPLRISTGGGEPAKRRARSTAMKRASQAT